MFEHLTRTLRSGGLDESGKLYKGYWSNRYPQDKRKSPTAEELAYHIQADPNNMIGWIPGFDDCLVIDVDRGSNTPSFQKLCLLLHDYLVIDTQRGKHLIFRVSSSKQRISPPAKFTYGQCGGELIYKSNHIVVWDVEKLNSWLETSPLSNDWPPILHALKQTQSPNDAQGEEQGDDEEDDIDPEIEELLDEILATNRADVPEGGRNSTLFSLVTCLRRRYGSPGQFDTLKQVAYNWVGEDETRQSWEREVDQVFRSASKIKVKVSPHDFNVDTIRYVCEANDIQVRFNKRRLYPEVNDGTGWKQLENETNLILFLNDYYKKLNLPRRELEKVRYGDTTLRTFYKVLRAYGEVTYHYDPLLEALESYIPLLDEKLDIFAEWRDNWGINSFDEVFIKIFGLKDEYRLREFTVQFWTSMAMKIISDHYIPYPHSMLLTGKPGIGKSQAAHALLPIELAEYTTEIELETIDKETYIGLTGRLLAVVEEMAGRSNYKVRKLKKLLTAPMYNYRELYAMRATDHTPIVSYVFVSNDEKASFEDEGMRKRLIPMEMSDWRDDGRLDAQEFLLKYNKFLLALGYERASAMLDSTNFNPLSGMHLSRDADEANRQEGMRTAKIDAESEMSKLRNALFNRTYALMDLGVVIDFNGVLHYAWTIDSLLTFINSRYALSTRKLAGVLRQEGWMQIDTTPPSDYNAPHKCRRLRYWFKDTYVKDDSSIEDMFDEES